MLLIRKERSLENQLKSEKFNKNLIHVDSEKKDIQPTETTKRVSVY